MVLSVKKSFSENLSWCITFRVYDMFFEVSYCEAIEKRGKVKLRNTFSDKKKRNEVHSKTYI